MPSVKNTGTKPVPVISTDENQRKTYYPAIEAAVMSGFNGKMIRLCIRGQREQHGGFWWRRATQAEIEKEVGTNIAWKNR